MYCCICKYHDDCSMKSEGCLDQNKQKNHENQNQMNIIGVSKGGDSAKCL